MNVCINNINYPPHPPPPHQMNISRSRTRSTVETTARATASSGRNHSQKSVERATTDRYIQIIPYDGSRGSDYQRVKKVLQQLGGVKSWEVNSDHGKLTVSTVHYPETIINALKHEFSSHRRITVLVQKTHVISSKPHHVSGSQDKALLQGMQAMGAMIAAHASQGLVDNMVLSKSRTIEGTETAAMTVNYVKRGTVPSVPKDHFQAACSHATTSRRRVGFTTTFQETSRSKEITTRSY